MSEQFVAYLRVSREKQGKEGLGMSAQRSAVLSHVGAGDLIAEFAEVETGKRDDRPELRKAIGLCKATGSKLVIAKLDRLSRDVHFLTGLEKAGIDFVCCDMPQADRFTIHIIAAMAQREREMISARTKAALAEIKAKIERGEPHVSRNSGKPVERLGGGKPFTPDTIAQGRQVRSQRAAEAASKIAPTLRGMRSGGMTLQEIADALNLDERPSPGGARWSPTSVKRVLDRAA